MDKYIGIIEFQTSNDEFHVFDIVQRGDVLIAGNPTNSTFLESYSYELDEYLTFDEHLSEFISDIEERVGELV